MDKDKLSNIATKLVAQNKGILAADESNPTCTKRLASINVESSYENRNEYRDMLFSTPNLEEFISGVILYDETIRQSTTCIDKILIPDFFKI